MYNVIFQIRPAETPRWRSRHTRMRLITALLDEVGHEVLSSSIQIAAYTQNIPRVIKSTGFISYQAIVPPPSPLLYVSFYACHILYVHHCSFLSSTGICWCCKAPLTVIAPRAAVQRHMFSWPSYSEWPLIKCTSVLLCHTHCKKSHNARLHEGTILESGKITK